ncbi:hypothetical protein PAXINDRAFT_6600 [Paxillus involutus ATCC 200175]|nr:hypothetical protein PAXINDRAFT_6600 [Paxillus involutus ATCC 200175]
MSQLYHLEYLLTIVFWLTAPPKALFSCFTPRWSIPMPLLTLLWPNPQFNWRTEDSRSTQSPVTGSLTLSCAWECQGCKEAFVRASQLESHFEHAHRDLHEKRISPDALAPLAILAPPRPLQSPPTLPDTETGTHVVLTSIAKAPIRPGGSQASGSQAISRKWSRLDVQDVETNDDPTPFDDLPPHSASFETRNPTLVNIEVRSPLSVTTQSLLSRPQPVIHPPIRSHDVQQTILYPAFARKVDMGEA